MTRRTIELFCFIAALVLAALSFHAGLASHDEQQRLKSTLATQKEILDAADAHEKARNAALNDTLAQIARLKSSTQSPQEILRVLQQELQLPQPITLATTPARASDSSISRRGGFQTRPLPLAPTTKQGTVVPGNSLPPVPDKTPAAPNAPRTLTASPDPKILPTAPSAQIPASDLKPLFDFVQDCRTCQAQLAAAQHNSADDAAKIAALTRERDAAITASNGGTFLRRLRRNALWLALGAVAGYAAAKR
jgi:hypothetical protein